MTDLTDRSASEIVDLVHKRQVSAEEVLRAHVAKFESSNPKINAIVSTCFDRALVEARSLDSLASDALKQKPLAGLPYAVKDTIDAEGLPTTYGSRLFTDNYPANDAVHVARARQAGAIVIGKSNTPAFASGAQTNNDLFGLTRNPLDTRLTVTGSSGGAAAALAARMVPMADGSDLGGSLRTPASVCGVVGFRPTAGVVPRANNPIPYDALHVYGPMARSVEDIALFMSVFSGPDDACPLSIIAKKLDLKALSNGNVGSARIAWSSRPCGANVHPEVEHTVNLCRRDFESLGYIVEDACPDIHQNHEAHQVLVALNAVSELGQYFDDDRFVPNQRLRRFIERGQRLTGDEVGRARRIQADCWRTMEKFFNRFDFLVWPSISGLPYDAILTESEVDEDWKPVELTPSLNLPAISLPCGTSTSGTPVGLQIIGSPGSDAELLNISNNIHIVIS
ncbi:MAG: amidase family protein [Pseudomonadota bacterium]